MPPGVILAFVAYGLYSCCDAIIKGFGSDLTVHDIAFWTALFSLIPAIFTRPKGERWIDFWKMRHPRLLHLRGVAGLVGNMTIIYAFLSIPLAETYSIAFLAPIFIVFLSVLFLRETVSWHRWALLGLTFVGVLLVVRPGFRDLQLGHLAALVAAATGAISTTVMRRVAPYEKRVSLIAVPLTYILTANFALMLPTFEWPSLAEFALLLLIGGLGGTATIIFINATRLARASEIAPMQYSQIAFALLFGAVFFQEYPDLIAYFGLAVVVVFGVMNVISDETRIRIFSRWTAGAGPATAMAEVSKPIVTDDPPAETPAPGKRDAA